MTATATRQGELQKNDNHRWEIAIRGEEYPLELSCGSVIEVKIDGHWIRTSIEHGSDCGYYATKRGIRLCHGLIARVPD